MPPVSGPTWPILISMDGAAFGLDFPGLALQQSGHFRVCCAWPPIAVIHMEARRVAAQPVLHHEGGADGPTGVACCRGQIHPLER